jgi:hypothetical protein
VELVALPGKLNLTATPGDAEIRIEDRRYSGRIQGLELRQGRHTVTVSKTGFVTLTRDVDIKPGELQEITLALERKSAAVLVTEAESFLKAGNFLQAELISRSALEVDANNAKAHLALGHTLYNTGSHVESVRHFSRALAAGEEIRLPVAHHHGGFPDDNVCIGDVVIRKDNLAFQSRTAGGHDFSVPAAKIYQVKNEPQKERRVNINVGIPRGAREDKRDYNFHHPAAKAVPFNPGNPSTILVVRCVECDDRMVVLFSLLQEIKR